MERRRQATERRHQIFVGLTTLAGLAGLVLLLTAFGYLPTLLRSGYTVTLYTDDMSGLRENSRVMLWGRDVGEVKEVGFAQPGSPGRTYATLRINKEVAIPQDVMVRVESPLFGGGPVIALVGSEPGASALASDGSAVLTSAQIVDPLASIEQASEYLAEIKQTWNEVGQNINSLFGVEGDGLASLPRVVLGLEERLAELNVVMASAQEWLGDEELRTDVTETAKNARELTEKLDKAVTNLEERYAALADSAQKQLTKVDGTLDMTQESIATFEKRYIALADDAAKVVSSIDALVAKANSKDSTIGQLLTNKKLYQNLEDTSARLKLMTDEARLLIQKWQAEGLPIRLFN